MRVTCACPAEKASETLVEQLKKLGIEPIITSQVIRAVYEGPHRDIGEGIVAIYDNEQDHEIVVQYSDKERQNIDKQAAREERRAKRNAKRRGH